MHFENAQEQKDAKKTANSQSKKMGENERRVHPMSALIRLAFNGKTPWPIRRKKKKIIPKNQTLPRKSSAKPSGRIIPSSTSRLERFGSLGVGLQVLRKAQDGDHAAGGGQISYQSTLGLAERKATDLHTIRWRISLSEKNGIKVRKREALALQSTLTSERRKYLELCAKHAKLLTAHSVAKTSTEADNEDEKSGLQRGICRTITADVDRTYQTLELFRDERQKKMLTRILVVWAVENRDIGYRQVVSQILAIIVMALHKDYHSATNQPKNDTSRVPSYMSFEEISSWESPNDSGNLKDYPPLIFRLLDPEHTEPDSYSLLCKIMRTLHRRFGGGWGEGKMGGGAEAREVACVEASLHRVHHELLKDVDEELYMCLQGENVLPQLYLIRWMRLLFAREFCIDQVFILWDAIFEDLAIVEYLCVSLLEVSRTRYLNAASNGCLFQELLRPGAYVLWGASTLVSHARSLMGETRQEFVILPNRLTRQNDFASKIWNQCSGVRKKKKSLLEDELNSLKETSLPYEPRSPNTKAPSPPDVKMHKRVRHTPILEQPDEEDLKDINGMTDPTTMERRMMMRKGEFEKRSIRKTSRRQEMGLLVKRGDGALGNLSLKVHTYSYIQYS
ncbi:hypothetical protein AAMO2058_000075700 [Amorphochlora amoebiformis]